MCDDCTRQLTTGGHRAYLTAVEDAFGCEVDYAMLQKICGGVQHALARYFMDYNFCRIHQSLRVTPGMEAAFPIMFGRLKK